MGKVFKGVVVLGVLAAFLPATAAANSPSHEYQRIWKQERHYFGAEGMPAPLATFNQSTPHAWALTLFPAGAPRHVLVGRAETRGLRRGWPIARSVLTWEWGRIYGPDAQEKRPEWLFELVRRVVRGDGPRQYARETLPHWGENPRTILGQPAPSGVCPRTAVDDDNALLAAQNAKNSCAATPAVSLGIAP